MLKSWGCQWNVNDVINTWKLHKMGAPKNWNQITFFSEGVPVDGDDPAHVQWIYDKAKERAESFNIQGVTYRLTQGEGKNGIFLELHIITRQKLFEN